MPFSGLYDTQLMWGSSSEDEEDDEKEVEDQKEEEEEDLPVVSMWRQRLGSKRRRYVGDWSSSDDESSASSVPTCATKRPRKSGDDDEESSTASRTRAVQTNQHFGTGWMEHVQFKAIAKRFGGTATQYRVMFSSCELTDCYTKLQIPPKSLIVQRQIFTIHTGDRMFSEPFQFLKWKLPPETKRNNCIYDSMRPQFYTSNTPSNTHPFIALEESLHPDIKLMVSTFINDAKSGTTPLEFYGDNHGELYFRTFEPSNDQEEVPTKRRKVSSPSDDEGAQNQQSELEQKEDEDSRSSTEEADQPPPVGNGGAVFDYEELPRTQDNSCLGSDEEDDAVNAFDDDEPSTEQQASAGDEVPVGKAEASQKQSFFSSLLWRSSTKKKRKVFGGPKPQEPTSASFYVSGPEQSLVLVEGLAENTDSPVAASHDHLRDIFLNGRLESLPTKGRLVELLPNEALKGAWTASLVGDDGNPTRVSGLLRDSLRDLKGVRLSIRHDDFLHVRRLTDKKSMQVPGISGTTHHLHISSMDPSLGRMKGFVNQGVGDDNAPVVASISFAACEGCTSMADANSKLAGDLASELLVATRDATLSNDGHLTDLLSIPSNRADEPPTSSGVSFLCKVTTEDHYKVLVAQDEQGRTVALDVLFGVSDAHMSLSSTSTTTSTRPKLTAANLQQLGNNVDTPKPTRRKDELSKSTRSNCTSPRVSFGSFNGELKPKNTRTPVVAAQRQVLSDDEMDLSPAVVKQTAEKCVENTAVATKVTPFEKRGSPVPQKEETRATPGLRKVGASSALLAPAETLHSGMPFVTPYTVRRDESNEKETPEIPWSSPKPDSEASEWNSPQFNHHDTAPAVDIDVDANAQGPNAEGNLSDSQTMLRVEQSEKAKCRTRLRFKSGWRLTSLCLVFLVLLGVCIKLPQRFPVLDPFEGRRVRSLQNATFQALLDNSEESNRNGFSIIGSEWVSVTAVVVTLAIFGM